MRSRPVETRLQSKAFRWKASSTGTLPYLQYLPRGYRAKGPKRWPLMLFLHGSGERGTDLQRVAVHGPLKHVNQGKEFPFIIVAPQCPADQAWENDRLVRLLDHCLKRYPADRNHIYLTGISMGGFGAWNLAIAHPERFAAVVPVCGGGDMLSVLLADSAQAAEFKRLPVWAFHGGNDSVVPPTESQRMLTALKQRGAKRLKLTIYPTIQHNAWDNAYNNPKLYAWLLRQAR
ncbi:MAG: hypothetical protein A2498_01985 [Lentisphaerae bacterium RIFOXYC12_FULL_60_16]|nr:MAG: hypothetical protein A2498_01985 [Lentisphaerae bacterium RIFOXYC12_FULL_60_16]